MKSVELKIGGKTEMDLFWLNKDLVDLSDTEWESLCDHCGKCCLVKLEDQGDVAFTRFACKKYDLINGGCGTYSHRHHIVMSCLNIREILRSKNWNWLPDTCSYRLVFENKPLPYWHPLCKRSRSEKLGQFFWL